MTLPLELPVDLVDPVILVRISRTFRLGMSAHALYEATRGVWRLGARRECARMALAVYRDVVQEVYEISGWEPAGTAVYRTRSFDVEQLRGRWEFSGTVAAVEVRAQYVGRSVAQYIARGTQAPVIYVNVP